MKTTARLMLIGLAVINTATASTATEIARLQPQTWDAFAPRGKEVDCIYGDYVLKNDQLIVVIGEPLRTRNANLTVGSVGAMIIDLTRVDQQRDQLSAYHPNGMQLVVSDPNSVVIKVDGKPTPTVDLVSRTGRRIDWQASARSKLGLDVTIHYSLTDGHPYLSIETKISNPSEEDISLSISDLIRADQSFEFGNDKATGMFWAHDEWYRQAYGVIVEGRTLKRSGSRGSVLLLEAQGSATLTLAPGETHTIRRRSTSWIWCIPPNKGTS